MKIQSQNKRWFYLVAVLVSVVAISLGFVTGWFASRSKQPNDPNYKIWIDALRDEDSGITKKIINALDPESIRGFLQ